MLNAMKYLARLFWRWDVIAAVAVTIFATAGFGAIYGDQFTLAATCFSLSIALVVAKTLSWEDVQDHVDRVWISLLTVILGFVVLGISLCWVQYRIGVNRIPNQTAQNEPTPQQHVVEQPPELLTSSAPQRPPLMKKKRISSPKAAKNLTSTPSPNPLVKLDCVGSNCVAGNNYGTNTIVNQAPQPLSISEYQVRQIANDMIAFRGRNVDIEEDGLTIETHNLTLGIKRALSDAGLDVSGDSAVMNFSMGSGVRLQGGLTFCVGSDNQDAAVALAQALRNTGVLPSDRKIYYVADPQHPRRFMIGIAPTR